MKISSYETVEKAWGKGAKWLDLSSFGLKGMVVKGMDDLTFKRYHKLHLEQFATGGTYLEIFKYCAPLLKGEERLVLGMEYDSLYLYIVKKLHNAFIILQQARVGLFYGRDPKEIGEKAKNALLSTCPSSSRNQKIRRFFESFKVEELKNDEKGCIAFFSSIASAPLEPREVKIIERAIRLNQQKEVSV